MDDKRISLYTNPINILENMNNNSSINCSYLEQFPDEIFLEIFQYISLYDLYQNFYKLNQRINHILHSVTGLSLILNKPTDINDEAVSFFASGIYHLIVRYSNVIHFNRFPSLCSALPNLTHLTLHFTFIWNCEIMEDLCRQIISNKFPKLRSCPLWPPAFDHDCSIIETPLLTHIELKEGNFDDLCVVLHSCPNLKYLQMLVSIYAKTPSKPIQNLSVQRLTVSFIRQDSDWINKFDQLLSLLPNLQKLFLQICIIRMDFDQLSRILKQRVRHLQSLECEIHAIEIPVKFLNLQRYHPLMENIHFEDIDDCQCGGLKLCINGKMK